MKQLTISDVRRVLYDMFVHCAENYVSDEELSVADFWDDLGMDEQQVLTMSINLQNVHHVCFPKEVLQALDANNTVGTFLEAANALLKDLDEE